MNSTKNNIFQFKQFAVDQTGCGMKINTDGVLLGVLAEASDPSSVLDIGTGTGVIAMMLSQRFPKAKIESLEIDALAAKTAQKNFTGSQFSNCLRVYHQSFQVFSKEHPDKKYDLIVSNPPFFTNSLKNPDNQKSLARHTSNLVFSELADFIALHLTAKGKCYFILPLDSAAYIINEILKLHLTVHHVINISSSEDKAPHRQIIGIGFSEVKIREQQFVIYQSEKKYSEQYKNALGNFLTIF